MSIFARVAVVELRARSRVRSYFGIRLWDHRAKSNSRFGIHSTALGQGRAAADVFLGEEMVSALARRHLPHRIHIALGAGDRASRCKRNFAGKSISFRGLQPDWSARGADVSDALLVQYQRLVSLSPLRRRRGFGGAAKEIEKQVAGIE